MIAALRTLLTPIARAAIRMAFVALAGLCSVASAASNGEQADIIGVESCDERIVTRVEYHGNEVTRARILDRDLPPLAGAPCDPERIRKAIDELWNLGLFRQIQASVATEGADLIVRYHLEEKYYLLPVPRFSRTSDGELRYGAQLRWDNVAGLLHQLRVTAEKREPENGEGREGRVAEIDYDVPRILGTDYGFSLAVANQQYRSELGVERQAIGVADRESRVLGLSLRRWLETGSWIGGISLSGGIRIEQRDYELLSGSLGPYSSGTNILLSFGFDKNEVVNERYRRRGRRLGTVLSIADASWGSDWNYRRIDLLGRWYRVVPGTLANLNLQLRMSFSDGAPFGFPLHSIGGGDVLRGMANGAEDGNQLALLNIEYLRAFAGYPTWRWVLFADIGNTWQISLDGLDDPEMRTGVGFRYRIEALSRTDLRLDFAWDPTEERVRPYFSTSLTF